MKYDVITRGAREWFDWLHQLPDNERRFLRWIDCPELRDQMYLVRDERGQVHMGRREFQIADGVTVSPAPSL